MRVQISLLLFCVLQFSCAATNFPINDEYKIVHVVLVWLQEPENQNHIDEVIRATHMLSEIPEVQEIRVGKSISSERPIVDDSFDVGLSITFTSKEALEAYLIHPKHIETVKSVFRPLASKILVYDFEDDIR